VNLLDVLVQIPFVFGLQLTVGTVIDNILMFGLNMFLDVANLGILVVTKVTLVFNSLMLAVDVSLQRSLVNGDEVTQLAVVSHPPVD